MTNTVLPVVHIHLGPTLPSYYWKTVRQTRRFHSGPIYCVLPPEGIGVSELEEFDAHGIPNTRWNGAPAVRRLRAVSWLNRLYGADGFWHYTLERLFVLAALMRDEGLSRILHLENDVTIYFDPAKMAETMERCFGEQCAATPSGPSEGCTAAVLYAGSGHALEAICEEIIALLPLGERKLRAVLPSGMVNESILLGIVQRRNPDLVRSFPIAPTSPVHPAINPRLWARPAAPLLRLLDRMAPRVVNELPPHALSNCLDEFGALFDGSSWGQFAGGTPHGHGPGTAFRHQWIGPDLLSGRYVLDWRTGDAGRRLPFVVDRSNGGREWKLNNLHIHCKRIEDFV
jgi:hypothetical protein